MGHVHTKTLPKKRGRPKGSKNKVKATKAAPKKVPKKKAAKKQALNVKKTKATKTTKAPPKKAAAKQVKKTKKKPFKKEKVVDDLSRIRISRFLGYCPEGHMIAARDKRTPRTFICEACDKKYSTSKLYDSKKEENKPLNKASYLNDLRSTGEIKDNVDNVDEILEGLK